MDQIIFNTVQLLFDTNCSNFTTIKQFEDYKNSWSFKLIIDELLRFVKFTEIWTPYRQIQTYDINVHTNKYFNNLRYIELHVMFTVNTDNLSWKIKYKQRLDNFVFVDIEDSPIEDSPIENSPIETVETITTTVETKTTFA